MNCENSKSSEVDLSLKTKKGWYIVLFLLGNIFVNYFILTYARTCRYIDFGILGGFTTSILLGFIFHVVLISLFIKKRLISILWVLFVWGTIVLLPELILRLISWDSTEISLPDMLNRTATVLLTCCYFAVKSTRAKNMIIALLTIIFLICFLGFSYWSHKISFNTFTGRVVHSQIAANIEFCNDGTKENLDSIYDEYLFLYVWITRCGYCYESFPKLQEEYEDFSSNNSFSIYALHCWAKNENEKTGMKKLQEIGYTFPCLSIPLDSPFLVETEVAGYPTVLILNRKRELVFRGRLDNAIEYIKEFAKSKYES